MKTSHSTHPHKAEDTKSADPKSGDQKAESTLLTKDATPAEKDPRATVTAPGSDVTKAIGDHAQDQEVVDVLKALMARLHGGTDTGLHTALFNRAQVAINYAEGKVKGVKHHPFDPTRRPEDQVPLAQEELKGSPAGALPESGIPTVHGAGGDQAARTH